MATDAQTQANTENAQASTGPQTPEGKLHSSANSLKFGLFSTKNCVLPEETEEYSNLARGLWESLSPIGPVEEMFATEIVRNAWRLHRCASTEATLADVPEPSTQAAVDRARTQATGALQRTMAELRRLQTERWARREVLPKNYDVLHCGIAASRLVIDTLSAEAHRKLVVGKVRGYENFWEALRTTGPLPPRDTGFRPAETASAKRTQSRTPALTATARNAPCPCDSGLKYKRCCGTTSLPTLHAAA
jgi:hypothetical protein